VNLTVATSIVGFLAVAGQLANLILHLTLRAELATLEKRILDQVRKEFLPRETWEIVAKRAAPAE
jgi:hypothetical protein